MVMTATARRLQSTPMAPYIDVMRSLDVDDMHLVVEFMNEAIREAEEAKRKADDEFLAKKMAEFREANGGMPFRDSHVGRTVWDEQQAWNELTDAQRAQAEKLNLTPSDMDARTFSILTKWIRE